MRVSDARQSRPSTKDPVPQTKLDEWERNDQGRLSEGQIETKNGEVGTGGRVQLTPAPRRTRRGSLQHRQPAADDRGRAPPPVGYRRRRSNMCHLRSEPKALSFRGKKKVA